METDDPPHTNNDIRYCSSIDFPLQILVNVKDVCPTDRGESDQISKEDFIEHHSDISFSVPSDTEFRQLVLKCWGIDSDSDHATDRGHMPPDEITTEEKTLKQACRTVTRRRNFVVTYLDGSQAVQELPFPSEVRAYNSADPIHYVRLVHSSSPE